MSLFPLKQKVLLFYLEVGKDAFYGGDEMGIACDITPPGKHKQVVVCSLTQFEIVGTSALLDELRVYQEIRKKKLAELPDSVLGDITIKRSRKTP